MKSKFFSLSLRDFIKGMIVAILTAAYTYVQSVIITGFFDWKILLFSTVAGFLGYLTKNLFTNSKDQILKNE